MAGFVFFQNFPAPAAGSCFLFIFSAPAAGFVCSIVSAPAAGSCFSFVKLSHLMLLPSLSRLGPPRQNKFCFGPLSDPPGSFLAEKEVPRMPSHPIALDHSPVQKNAKQKTVSWYPACRRTPPPRPLPLAQKNSHAKNYVVVPRMPSQPSP